MWFEKKMKNEEYRNIPNNNKSFGIPECPAIVNHTQLRNERTS